MEKYLDKLEILFRLQNIANLRGCCCCFSFFGGVGGGGGGGVQSDLENCVYH